MSISTFSPLLRAGEGPGVRAPKGVNWNPASHMKG